MRIAGLTVMAVFLIFALLEERECGRAMRAKDFQMEVRWRLRSLLSWAIIIFCAVIVK